MARRTKKVGSTGRFGPRYGLNVRRRVRSIEESQNKDHPCPRCLTGLLDRTSTAIWQCRKCDHKFAGGAYVPATIARERGGQVRLEAGEETLEAAQEVMEEAEEPSEAQVTEGGLPEEPDADQPEADAAAPTDEPTDPSEEERSDDEEDL